MKAYWTRLNDRERSVILFGIITLCILGFYFGIYEPINQLLNERVTLWQENTETLSWMQKVRKQYNSLQLQEEQNKSGQPLLLVLSKALKQTQLSSFQYQLSQVEGKKIQLHFEKVPYVLFLSWLKQISSRQSLQIDTFEVERSETAGIVKLNIVVSE